MGSLRWIKMRAKLDEDPSVLKMAHLLKMHELDVIGRLWRVWTWADQQSLNGNDMPVTEALLDRYAVTPGFAKAMREVGWLTGEDWALTFPNFKRHNTQTAKTAILTASRVQAYRARKRGLNPVTQAPLQGNADVTVDVTQLPLQSNATSVTKNKNKNKSTVPPTIPLKGGSMDFEEALTFLDNVFGRKKKPWSQEERELLWAIVRTQGGVDRQDARLIRIWFRLPPDHDVFRQSKDRESTRRKQELTTFLRDYNGEMDKIRRFAPMFLEPELASAKKDPPRWKEFYRWLFPEAENIMFPDHFDDMAPDLRAQYERRYQEFEQAKPTTKTT